MEIQNKSLWTISPLSNEAGTSITRWFRLLRKGRERLCSASMKGLSTTNSQNADVRLACLTDSEMLKFIIIILAESSPRTNHGV
jgi:hypothetical protein